MTRGPFAEVRSSVSARLNARLVARDRTAVERLLVRPPDSGRRTPAAVALAAVSVLLGLAILGMLAGGVALIVRGAWPVKLLGVLLVLVAVAARPRVPREQQSWCAVRRADQPSLFDLVDRVGRLVRAPRIDEIVLDESFGVRSGRRGFRHRAVLTIGLPLWLSLDEQARVALLAQNLASSVGVLRHSWFGQPALATFGRLAELVDPRRSGPRRVGDNGVGIRETFRKRDGAFFTWMGSVVTDVVCTPLWLVLTSVNKLVLLVSAREKRYDQVWADAAAVRIAGSAATIEYLETLLLSERYATAARRWLRVGAGPGMVAMDAAQVRERSRADLPRFEAASVGKQTLLDECPALGTRLRLVRSWPTVPGSFTASPSVTVQERELTPVLRRVERTLSHQA